MFKAPRVDARFAERGVEMDRTGFQKLLEERGLSPGEMEHHFTRLILSFSLSDLSFRKS